jgi:hypothetical protein
MRALLIAVVLSSVGGAVCAQPAGEGSKMLDTCFQLANAANTTCSDPKNGEAERLDCRRKASMTQLECLGRVFPGRSAETVPPETPPRTVSPERPPVTASTKVPAGSSSPEAPVGTVAKGEPTGPQEAPPGTVPRGKPPGNRHVGGDHRYRLARRSRKAR